MTRKKIKRIVWLIFLIISASILSGCTLPFNLETIIDDAVSIENPLAPSTDPAVSITPTLKPPRLTQTPSLTNTPIPAPSKFTYNDDTYRLAFEYPSTWSLYILPAGRQTGSGFAAKTLQFVNGNTKLMIQYNFLWDKLYSAVVCHQEI